MDIRQLGYFIEVAKHQSFAKSCASTPRDTADTQ